MTLTELLQTIQAVFQTLWNGFINLSNASPLFDITQMLSIIGLTVLLIKMLKKK